MNDEILNIVFYIGFAVFGYILVFGSPGNHADAGWLIPSPLSVLKTLIAWFRSKLIRKDGGS